MKATFVDCSTTQRLTRRANAAILVAAAVVSVCPGHRLAAQDTSPRYHVRIPADARHAEVTVVLPTRVTRLFMDSVQAQHLANGWASFVRELRVRAGGDLITLERRNPIEWLLPAGIGPLTFDYRVDLAFTGEPWPAGNEQAGARFDDALYLVGRALFIDTDAPGSRRVTFELPPGWRVSAPWRPIGDGELAFLAEDGTDLVRNSFVVGRHASVRVMTDSFDLELALPGAVQDAAPLVEPALRRVVAAYLRLFSDTLSTRYLMTFFLAQAEDGEAFTRSAAFTTADSVDADGLIVWGNFLAHELFHFWNGQRIRGAGPRMTWRWMAEGFTEYYANVTLAREGLIPASLFLKKAERHLGNYLYFMTAPAFTRMSLVDAGRNTSVNRFGVYDGGWAVAFCLDGLIRERSSDRASLDDFVRALWQLAQAGSPGYSVAELDALADRLAGGPLGTFVARHVEGSEVLPLRGCLERVGLTGAFKGYAAEAFLFPDGNASPAASSRGRALYGVR